LTEDEVDITEGEAPPEEYLEGETVPDATEVVREVYEDCPGT